MTEDPKENNTESEAQKAARNRTIAIIITIIVAAYGLGNYLSKSPLERSLPGCNSIFGPTETQDCRYAKSTWELEHAR